MARNCIIPAKEFSVRMAPNSYILIQQSQVCGVALNLVSLKFSRNNIEVFRVSLVEIGLLVTNIFVSDSLGAAEQQSLFIQYRCSSRCQ